MRETWVQSLGQEDPLEKEMATHSSILAWRIPCMEEPGRPQSMGSQRVGHDWVTSLSLFTLNKTVFYFASSWALQKQIYITLKNSTFMLDKINCFPTVVLEYSMHKVIFKFWKKVYKWELEAADSCLLENLMELL